MTDIPQRSVRSLAQLFNDSNQDDFLNEMGSDDSDGEVIEDSLQSPLSTSGGFMEVAKDFESKFGAGSSRIFWKRKPSSPTSESEETLGSKNDKPPERRSRLHWNTEKPDFLKDPVEEKQNVNENCELQDVSDDENRFTDAQPETNSPENQPEGSLKGFMASMKTSIRLFTEEDLQQFLKMTQISSPQETKTFDPMNKYYDENTNRNKAQEQTPAEEYAEQLSTKEMPTADDKIVHESQRTDSVSDKTDEDVTSSVSKPITPRKESNDVAEDETDSKSLGDVTNFAKTFKVKAPKTTNETGRETSKKVIDFSQTFILKTKPEEGQNDSFETTGSQSQNNSEPPSRDTFLKEQTVNTDIPDDDTKHEFKTMESEKKREAISSPLTMDDAVDTAPTCRWNPEKWNYRCAKQKDVSSPVVKWPQHKKLADHKINKIFHDVFNLPVNLDTHFKEQIPTKVKCVALGHKSGRVMVTGKGTDVSIWAVGKPNPVVTLSGSNRPVDFVTFGHGEELVAASATSGAIRLWDIEHSKSASELAGHCKSVMSLDFEPMGNYMVSGSLDNTIKLWDIRRYGCINSLRPKTKGINSVRFSPDGKWLASAEDGCVKLWDLTAGKRFERLDDHAGLVTTVEFHPHELLLASGDSDRNIKLWDLETFHVVSSSNGNFEPLRLLFHSNGRRLLCGGRDELRIYDWNELRSCQLVSTSWGELSDLAICNNELIAATIAYDKVWCYVVNLETFQLTHGSPVKKRQSTSSADTKPGLLLTEGEHNEFTPSGRSNRMMQRDTDHVPQETERISKIPVQSRNPKKDPSKINKPKYSPGAKASTQRLLEQTPARNPTIEEPSEQELMTAVVDGHSKLTNTMSDRSRNLHRIRDVWSTRKEKKNAVVEAMDLAINIQDKAILMSLLQILGCCKLTLWSLDLCVLLLPQIEVFLNDDNERFVLCGVDGVKKILEKYGPMIKENVAAPPGKTVDVNREERYQKCCACYKTLTSIKEVVSRKQKDHLHQHYNELYDLLCAVIPDQK